MRRLLCAATLTLTLLCLSAAGDGVDAQLKSARRMFDDSMSKVDDGHLEMVETCRHNYSASLKQAEAAVTKRGDLDAVVLLRKEHARFTEDRAVDDEIKPNTHPAIKIAIAHYLRGIEAAEASRSRKLGALGKQYIAHLHNLKKKLTVDQNIDDALKVRQVIKDASSDPILKEAMSYKPPPTTRGRNCTTCSGTGFSKQACKKCSASGICHYCKGRGKNAGLSGSTIVCHACSGSGECGKCKGAKAASLKCTTCNGIGMTLR